MAGKRIDDHSSWIGGGDKGSVFPSGNKVRMESSANGAGELDNYYDTSEKIKERQEMSDKKIKSNPIKSGFTN